METIIAYGFLAGLDNLEVVPALGLARLSGSRKWMMAAGFGLFEALMPLIGLMLGSLGQRLLPVANKTGPVTLIACAVLMLLLALRKKDLSRLVGSGWMIVVLPMSLSLDNMVAGVGLGAVGYPIVISAFLIGLISGLMALAGLFFGKLIGDCIPDNADIICGVYLIILGVVKLM